MQQGEVRWVVLVDLGPLAELGEVFEALVLFPGSTLWC